jgi:hypothetical protein
MPRASRRTGIGVVGDVPWGTHFCQFYETKQDLLDTLVPYFKAGLEDGEFCVWVVSEPISADEAWNALRRVVPDLDRYLSGGTIEMFPAREWYLDQGTFDLERVTRAWSDKLSGALARGYPGMRVSGSLASILERFRRVAPSAPTGEWTELMLALSNRTWLEMKDWADFCEYEQQLDRWMTDRRMAALCAYPLVKLGAAELLDVRRNHQFAIAKRQGAWDVIPTAPHDRGSPAP